MRDHDVLEERGIPARDLGMFAFGLGYGIPGKALDALTGTGTYPAALHPLAPGGVQSLIAEPEPQDQPHRGHARIGEQEAGYARLGDTALVVCCGPAHISLLPFLATFTGGICTLT